MIYVDFIGTSILYNCSVISPSNGVISVSCDSSHQIQITLICTDNCTNPLLITYGNSPLTVRGLDPGIIYTVLINIFDGNEVVLRNYVVTQDIRVMGETSGKS